MVNLMDQVYHIEESDLSPIQDQIGETVEQLRDLFFSRYTYQDDIDWLINVGSLIHEMCELTNNDLHHMYPNEEFIESYVTG